MENTSTTGTTGGERETAPKLKNITKKRKYKSGSEKKNLKRKADLALAASDPKQKQFRFFYTDSNSAVLKKSNNKIEEDDTNEATATDGRQSADSVVDVQKSPNPEAEVIVNETNSESSNEKSNNKIEEDGVNKNEATATDGQQSADSVVDAQKSPDPEAEVIELIAETVSNETNSACSNKLEDKEDTYYGSSINEDDEAAAEDLSYFVQPRLNASSAEKLHFLRNHPIQPSSDVNKLPFEACEVYYRRMPNQQLVQRKWLSYSLSLNKVFCVTCMAFCEATGKSPFITGIIPSCKNIYNQLETHEKSKTHQLALMAYMLADRKKDLESRNKKAHNEAVKERRIVLRRIIDIIMFIGSQGISYRGKEESACSLDDGNHNHGNFLALVLLLAKYDPVLSHHVSISMAASRKRKEKNRKSRGRGSLVTFLSKTTVNRLIKICGNYVKSAIVKQVKEARQYSLEVDSCQDVGVIDQVALCVRYVRDGNVNERLLAMTPIRRSAGRQYFELVKSELQECGLDLKNVISSAFDGAANMSGRYNGLQAALKEVSPDMIYTHCYAHSLNLVLGDTCSSCVQAQTLFGLLEKTAVFISESYKRMGTWTEVLQGLVQGRDKLRKLQKIGKTRWWAKDRALQTVFHVDRYTALLKTLYTIAFSKEFESKVAFEAKSLMESFLKFEVILTAFTFKRLFSLTSPTSKYLQTVQLDYLKAHNMVKSLEKQLLADLNTFDKVYEEAVSFATAVNSLLEDTDMDVELETSLPLKRVRSVKRMFDENANDEAANIFQDAKTKFCISVYKVVMNTAVSQLSSRFKDCTDLMKDAAFLAPKNFKTIQKNSIPKDALSSLAKLSGVDRDSLIVQLESFASSYKDLCKDLPDALQQDVDIADSDFENNSSDPESDTECPPCNDKQTETCKLCIPCACKFLQEYNLHCSAYSDLFVAYTTVLTVAFTQVTCERRFSKLKIIKNRLRSSIDQELLESFLLLNTELDIVTDMDYEFIIDEFAKSSTQLKKLLS